jgi:hypothetical protein
MASRCAAYVSHGAREAVANVYFPMAPVAPYERASVRVGQEVLLDMASHVHALAHAHTLRSEATNYSIRSPYPTLHFLRERDIMAAVTSGYPQVTPLPAPPCMLAHVSAAPVTLLPRSSVIAYCSARENVEKCLRRATAGERRV